MTLSQRKYALDLLHDIGLLGCKLENTSIEQNPSFQDKSSVLLEELNWYKSLIGKSIYLTVTWPDISFAVLLLNQFMHEPIQVHQQGTLCKLTYIKSTPGKGLIYRKHGHLQIEVYSYSDYAGDRGTGNIYRVIIPMQVVTWSLGEARSRISFHDLVQKQNTEQWPRQVAR